MRRGPAVSLSLKQRLGQLAASTPSTPLSPPGGATSPRKSYFPTWGPKRGRTQTDDQLASAHDEERMQDVVSKFIFQAGVDFECVATSEPCRVRALTGCDLQDTAHVSCGCVRSDIALAYRRLGSSCLHVPSPTRARFHTTCSWREARALPRTLELTLSRILQSRARISRPLWCGQFDVRAERCSRTPVESDYTVVFFAAGNKHTPGWNWIWKAYRSLSRKYRKHLKKLVRPRALARRRCSPSRRSTSCIRRGSRRVRRAFGCSARA